MVEWFATEFCCYSEERIRNGAKKLEKSRTTVTQGRLDSFFQVVSVSPSKRKVVIVIFGDSFVITLVHAQEY